jgi:hypothetical protein
LLEVSFAGQLLPSNHTHTHTRGESDPWCSWCLLSTANKSNSRTIGAYSLKQLVRCIVRTAALAESNALVATITAVVVVVVVVVVVTATIIFGHCLVDGAGTGATPRLS